MEPLKHQIRSELKQLPLMLGKLFGGIAAVVGFTAIVLIQTRKLGSPLMPFVFLGSGGIIVFMISARLLTKRLTINTTEPLTPANKTRTSALSWSLLLLFAGLFLICIYFMTR
jgi:zinc transporter ZupT